MEKYKHLLLAVELESSCDTLPVLRAQMLAKEFGTKITLIHAVEHITSYGAAYGVAAGADIEEMLIENATQAINEVAEKIGVPAKDRIVRVGPAKVIIVEEAEKLGVDLIVIGSHGRHGIRLLLGSTANGVLHMAKTDVLAVRIKD